MKTGTINNAAGFTVVGLLVVLIVIAAATYYANRYFARQDALKTVSEDSYEAVARIGSVENAAAAAAEFLSSARIQGAELFNGEMDNPLTANNHWTVTLPGGSNVQFVCPPRMEITVDEHNARVQVTSGTKTSEWHFYE